MNDMPLPAEREGSFTYADYLTWSDEERWELFEGTAFDMTPAPTVRHQQILGRLHLEIGSVLRDSPCQVLLAPLDVRLPEGSATADDVIRSVVQPDLLVTCAPSEKLDKAGCLGAPDLVVEILSPSTAFKDQTAKLTLYEKHGVKEYWIVNPVRETVLVYRLEENGTYGKPEEFRKGETLDSAAVAVISVVLDRVFQ